jgi:hypothetical protein
VSIHDSINMDCWSVHTQIAAIQQALQVNSIYTYKELSPNHRLSILPCLIKISSISLIERHLVSRTIRSRALSFLVQLAGSAPQAGTERTIWPPLASSLTCPSILRPFCMSAQVIWSIETDAISFVGHQSVYKWRQKDTVLNCIDTNEFVWNMPTSVRIP